LGSSVLGWAQAFQIDLYSQITAFCIRRAPHEGEIGNAPRGGIIRSAAFVSEGRLEMSDDIAKRRRLLQLELDAEVVETIDRLADEETISRSAWARRALMGAAKEARAA
jgi:hypothetical protein